ncbi:MAG: Conserved helix repeat-containing protein [Streptosporangiaceae bacterium]|jgi:small-conductance mechanosensitive channel|nr:Conserved helix repeat-containing protein [Streptosporangiaceae bacterium]
MNIRQSLQNMFNSIAHTVPKILVFLIILVVGWVIARALRKLVDMVLERVGFDRMVERGLIGDTLRRSEYDASSLVAALVYYAILLITLQMAFGVFGPNPVTALLASVVAWLPRAIVAVILIVVASAIAKVVKDLVSTALGRLSYGPLIGDVAAIFIMALGVIAALNQIGIATTVTEPVLITVLATIGAVIAIGAGGGLIRPMQARWERILSSAESETGKLRGASYQRGREDAIRGSGVPTEQTTQQTTHPNMPGSGAGGPTYQ